MSEKVIENNKVSVIGEIISGFTFSHEVFGEGFYLVNVAVNRLSEQADIIPLMISERLLDVKEDYIGCTVEAIGQFRSYNRHEGVCCNHLTDGFRQFLAGKYPTCRNFVGRSNLHIVDQSYRSQ